MFFLIADITYLLSATGLAVNIIQWSYYYWAWACVRASSPRFYCISINTDFFHRTAAVAPHLVATAGQKNSTFVNALIDTVTFPCFSNNPNSSPRFFSLASYIFICHVEQVWHITKFCKKNYNPQHFYTGGRVAGGVINYRFFFWVTLHC